MSKKYEFSLDEELRVTCSISAGHPGDSGFRRGVIGLAVNPTPPEPAEIEDLAVFVTVLGGQIDVTDLLDAKQMRRLEDAIWAHVSESKEGK